MAHPWVTLRSVTKNRLASYGTNNFSAFVFVIVFPVAPCNVPSHPLASNLCLVRYRWPSAFQIMYVWFIFLIPHLLARTISSEDESDKPSPLAELHQVKELLCHILIAYFFSSFCIVGVGICLLFILS